MFQERELITGYTVVQPSQAEQDRLLDDVIPKRKGAVGSVPGLTMGEGLLAGDYMFEKFGLPQFVGCVTGEMASRPVPHVFKEAEVADLVALVARVLPHVMRWYIPQITAPYQAYNAVSRVGWPGFIKPDNKLQWLQQFMPDILAGDLSLFENAYIVCNTRLQNEDPKKKRTFQFVTTANQVYERVIDGKDKQVRTPLGKRTGSRPRLIFNQPAFNLVKQVLDTAIHNVFLRHPAFHHDMFNQRLLPIRGKHIAMDVKHFERHTATCNRLRAKLLGGVYAKCGEVAAKLPFACPTDDWLGARLLYVNRDLGFSEQYGSGDSAVSPSQKEILMCLYASFFEQEFGYSIDDAIKLVAAGGNEKMTIRNYGDDNSIDGDESVCRAFMAYAGQYLHVEEENPPMFLGFEERLGRWYLRKQSYLTKLFLNERAPYTSFREYPNMGWVERRKIYTKLGTPDIASDIFPAEDKLLEDFGLPWYEILRRADAETIRAMQAAKGQLNEKWLMEREYAMTAEEKMATGMYTGLTPRETAPMIMKLLGQEHHRYLHI